MLEMSGQETGDFSTRVISLSNLKKSEMFKEENLAFIVPGPKWERRERGKKEKR